MWGLGRRRFWFVSWLSSAVLSLLMVFCFLFILHMERLDNGNGGGNITSPLFLMCPFSVLTLDGLFEHLFILFFFKLTTSHPTFK